MHRRTLRGLLFAAGFTTLIVGMTSSASAIGRSPCGGPYGWSPGWMMGYGYGGYPGWERGWGPGWMMSRWYGPWAAGPGMMGWGYGGYPGWGHGWGPGWMMGGWYGPWGGRSGPTEWRYGAGGGWGGGWSQEEQSRNLNLSVAQVKERMENWLRARGNPNIKLGAVKQTGPDTISADVVTKDKDGLVQQYVINRRNGFVTPARPRQSGEATAAKPAAKQ